MLLQCVSKMHWTNSWQRTRVRTKMPSWCQSITILAICQDKFSAMALDAWPWNEKARKQKPSLPNCLWPDLFASKSWCGCFATKCIQTSLRWARWRLLNSWTQWLSKVMALEPSLAPSPKGNVGYMALLLSFWKLCIALETDANCACVCFAKLAFKNHWFYLTSKKPEKFPRQTINARSNWLAERFTSAPHGSRPFVMLDTACLTLFRWQSSNDLQLLAKQKNLHVANTLENSKCSCSAETHGYIAISSPCFIWLANLAFIYWLLKRSSFLFPKRRQQWRWLVGAIARSGEVLRAFFLLALYWLALHFWLAFHF